MAAKIFPFGTALTILWHFAKPDGSNFNVEGYTYRLYYRTGNKETEVESPMLSSSGNTITFTIPATAPVAPGEYALRLVLFQHGSLFCRFVYNNAFVLSRRMADASIAEEQTSEGSVVNLYTVAEYYMFSPVIPIVSNNGYWVVNGETVVDGRGNPVPSSHTLTYDEETGELVIDQGRRDGSGASIEQRISSLATALESQEERYTEAEAARGNLYAAAEAERNSEYESAEIGREAAYQAAEGDKASSEAGDGSRWGEFKEAEGERTRLATEDHQQAGLDHQQAEYDHGEYESDHRRSGEDHEVAESDHRRAVEDHATATNDTSRAQEDHDRAEEDNARAALDHAQAENDHIGAYNDRQAAESDRGLAGSDRMRAESDHNTATEDHLRAEQDHTTAASDHTAAANDHTRAESDHTRAEADHTTAAADHTTAASDHTQATEDHAVMDGYDTRLGNVEGDVSQLGQDVTDLEKEIVDRADATITETKIVSSGTRMDKIIDLSAYVGRTITFKVTRTGGTSAVYRVYNSSYEVGSNFEYGKEYSYLLNSNMSSLRFLSVAAEESEANVTISIIVATLYGLENVIKKMFISKVVNYTGQLITGQYYNTYVEILPTNTTPFENCACISGAIKEGDILKIKGSATSDVIGFYAFYDSGKHKIMFSGAAGTNKQNALEVFAPAGSAYFVYNSYRHDTLYDSVSVEEVLIISDKIEELQTQSDDNTTRIDFLDGLTWKNKTVVCFGDSITEFADSHLKKYSDYLADVTGANVINVGVGGTRIACRTTPVANPSTSGQGYAALDCANLVDAIASQDFSTVDAGAIYVRDNDGDNNTAIIARLKAIEWSAVDAVTFFIGTNDWSGSQNMGTSGESSKTTTLGAVNFIIDTLLTAYPHLKIYWFTPIVRWISPRTDANWSSVLERGGRTLEQFCDLVANEVKLNCIPVCDMYHTLGWTKANFSQYFYDTDGTHPYNGFPEIGRKFAAFIAANKTF